jgi:hypothetical protein
MTVLNIFLALFFIFAPAIGTADEEQSVKEGFKETHEGMKKVAISIDKKAKKDWKAADKKAKENWKAVDSSAKKKWKKVGRDIKKATKD